MPVVKTEKDMISRLPDDGKEADVWTGVKHPLPPGPQAKRPHNKVSQRQQPFDPTRRPPEHKLRSIKGIQFEAFTANE